MRAPLLALSLAAFSVACSSDPAATPPAPSADGGGRDASPLPGDPDAGSPLDAGIDAAAPPPTEQTEAEPNDGKTTSEVGTMTLPGRMTGKLDPANDVDIFRVALTAGELYEWTLTPTGAGLTPHVTVFDLTPNNLNPTALVAGKKGAPLTLQHFVLRPGDFVAAVRDATNVPNPSGAGGPTSGYTLLGQRRALSPVNVAFPETKQGRLASLGAVDVYAFTTTNGKGFDIVLRAARKAQPSTLDSRMSLYDLGQKKAILTNDNAAGTTDSQIGGAQPLSGSFLVIVDNEGTDASDLSYELEFSLRP